MISKNPGAHQYPMPKPPRLRGWKWVVLAVTLVLYLIWRAQIQR